MVSSLKFEIVLYLLFRECGIAVHGFIFLLLFLKIRESVTVTSTV